MDQNELDVTAEAIRRTVTKLHRNWIMQLIAALTGACLLLQPELADQLVSSWFLYDISTDLAKILIPLLLAYLFFNYGFMADNYLQLRAIFDQEFDAENVDSTQRIREWRKRIDPSLFELMYRLSVKPRPAHWFILAFVFVGFNITVVAFGNAITLSFLTLYFPAGLPVRVMAVVVIAVSFTICYVVIIRSNNCPTIRPWILMQAFLCVTFTAILLILGLHAMK